jgi:mannose-6-phosphate isomerase-like protein (cupin superfamily)
MPEAPTPQVRVVQVGEAPEFECPPPDVRRVSFVIDQALCGAQQLTAGFFGIPAHGHSLLDVHEGQEELYYFISGSGRARLGGTEHPVQPGTVVFIPSSVPHQIHNDADEEMRLFFAFAPQPAGPYRHQVEGWPQVSPRPASVPGDGADNGD